MPIFYECDRCTACCRWPGEVRLDDGEIARISAFLKVPEVQFIQQHTRLTQDRRGLALNDKPNYQAFWKKSGTGLRTPAGCTSAPDVVSMWRIRAANVSSAGSSTPTSLAWLPGSRLIRALVTCLRIHDGKVGLSPQFSLEATTNGHE